MLKCYLCNWRWILLISLWNYWNSSNIQTSPTTRWYSSSCVRCLWFNWFTSFKKASHSFHLPFLGKNFNLIDKHKAGHIFILVYWKYKFVSWMVYIYANSICDDNFRLKVLTRKQQKYFTRIVLRKMTCISKWKLKKHLRLFSEWRTKKTRPSLMLANSSNVLLSS